MGRQAFKDFDLTWLRKQVRSGFRPKWLFFWGHRPRRDGRIGKSCLSQWWSASFEVSGLVYPSAEHFMMAEKAKLFGDEEIRRRIVSAPNPGAAKQLGRQVQGFDEQLWQQRRFDIVVAGNHAKFAQNHELGAYLLSTKKRVLVEASPVDRIWGIGLAEDDPLAQNPELWRGLNLLGFALMKVRSKLDSGAE